MLNFLFGNKNRREEDKVKALAREELKKNRAVFESLREYDEGKKEISTTNVEKHLRDLQHTS